jgi:hypothetical protein
MIQASLEAKERHHLTASIMVIVGGGTDITALMAFGLLGGFD